MSSSPSPPSAGSTPPGSPLEFSLVQGGLLFRVLRSANLADDALLKMGPCVIAIALLAWLPLLLLSALEGRMWGGQADVPFLLDVEVHIASCWRRHC